MVGAVLCWAMGGKQKWKKLTLNRLSNAPAGENSPLRGEQEEDRMAYRLGEDRWGFIAVETSMGKAAVDWL